MNIFSLDTQGKSAPSLWQSQTKCKPKLLPLVRHAFHMGSLRLRWSRYAGIAEMSTLSHVQIIDSSRLPADPETNKKP